MNRMERKFVAFTLIELLAVLFILALLMTILIPVIQKAKRSAIAILSANNQRETLKGLSCYTVDQDGKFPDSVATLGTGTRWSWREPTVLTGFQERSPTVYRSVSQYLQNYIESASTMFCPGAPSEYEYAEAAWVAGDDWDNPNPDTGVSDPLFGNYCLYWNYVGYLEEKEIPFLGPHSSSQGKKNSSLLISDYFGYGHWRNELTYGSRGAYGSCEKMPRGDITVGTSVACDFWSLFNPGDQAPVGSLSMVFRAGYIDGHVEAFTPSDVTVMKVSMTADGWVPYPDDIGPAGTIYIPRNY